MGNNESLPPPPPPTGPPNLPHVLPPTAPPAPPAYQPPPPPSYNPPTESFPPTTQFPATTQFPVTEPFPGGPPGGFPPDGATAFEQPAEPPKKKTGLMIAGGLVAVGAVIGAIVLLTGGDDDKSVTPGTTLPATSVVVETIPELTIPPEETLVITLPVITEPETTEPVVTEPPVTEPEVTAAPTTVVSGVDPVTDDLGVFTMVLPPGLVVDSTPITTQDDFVLPSIAGAVDLDGFYNDDVTPGMTALVVREDVGSTPAEVLAFLDPGDEVCARREQLDAHPTALGSAILLKLDECADGTAAKVILVIAIEGSTSIVAHYVQGPGASTDLLPEAQTVFESIRLL